MDMMLPSSMFTNYCLSFQSAGRGGEVGLPHSNRIFKSKCYKEMRNFGVFTITVNNTIPTITCRSSIHSSSSSHRHARSPKSVPYKHSQQFYQEELGLKTDQVQTFPGKIPAEQETHFDASKNDPDKMNFGLETERVRDRGGGPTSEEEGGKGKEESLGLEMERPIIVKPGRQMMKRSTMIAKQVISIQSALNFGFVSQLWVNTTSWTVLIVEVRPNLLSGEMERLLLEDIAKVGDVLLIEDESVMDNDFKLLGLETLVGYSVVTLSQRSIGKVRGYTFDINSGTVDSLELDSFGISIIPSSLVSTYGLFVEDVVEVSADTVVVHEAAASRIQRLTKGFWGASQKKMGSEYSGDDEEYYSGDGRGRDTEIESPQPLDDYRERRRKRGLFSRKKSVEREKVGESVEWELPMDYL